MSTPTLLQQMMDAGAVDDAVSVANVYAGGQLGLGINGATIDSFTPVVMPPPIIVVLHTPEMYANNRKMSRLIKTMLESYPTSVSGIDFGYTLGTDGRPAGHDGQELQVPLTTTRSSVNPAFTFAELSGLIVWYTFRKWVFDINQPDFYIGLTHANEPGRPRTMSSYSAAFIAIQPDVTFAPEAMLAAAVYYNVFPNDIGMLGLEKNVNTSRLIDRTITFQAMVADNDFVAALGRSVLGALRLSNIDFMKRQLQYNSVDAKLSNAGIAQEVAEAIKKS